MQSHEYLAVPAPAKGIKAKGLKTPAERYAHALSETLNDMAANGWEYWRAETLPSEERKGLTGSVTVYHSVLIFRRPSAEALATELQGTAGAVSEPVPPVSATETPPRSDTVSAQADSTSDTENLFSDEAAAPAGSGSTLPPLRLSTHAPEGPAPRLTATPRKQES